MIQLSLKSINAHSPYQLKESPLGGFDFDIDAGLTYNIALIEDHIFGDTFQTYMLNVLPHSMEEYYLVKNKRVVRTRKDDKIKLTVKAVLDELFTNKEVIVDYVCLTEDNRQTYRSRLFKNWFKEYNQNDVYDLFETHIEVDSMSNYLGAIIRKDNIQYERFCETFIRIDKEIHGDFSESSDDSGK